jgi:hypothetical protein
MAMDRRQISLFVTAFVMWELVIVEELANSPAMAEILEADWPFICSW